jgi:hypothetical protein
MPSSVPSSIYSSVPTTPRLYALPLGTSFSSPAQSPWELVTSRTNATMTSINTSISGSLHDHNEILSHSSSGTVTENLLFSGPPSTSSFLSDPPTRVSSLENAARAILGSEEDDGKRKNEKETSESEESGSGGGYALVPSRATHSLLSPFTTHTKVQPFSDNK